MSLAAELGHELTGSVAASDAFFPFPDGVEALHAAGVRAVIQPGGSIRDQEVIAALDLTMRLEGIIPALESSHAFVQAFKEAPELPQDAAIIAPPARSASRRIPFL